MKAVVNVRREKVLVGCEVMERLVSGEAEIEEIDALEKVTKQIGHTIVLLVTLQLGLYRTASAL